MHRCRLTILHVGNFSKYLVIFYFFLQEDDDVISYVKDLAPEPVIVIKGSLEVPSEVVVVAEKQVVCRLNDTSVLNAYVCFMAVCYVFMFSYPASIKNFCLYLQKCMLHIRDGKKLPTSIITFVNEIDVLVSGS